MALSLGVSARSSAEVKRHMGEHHLLSNTGSDSYDDQALARSQIPLIELAHSLNLERKEAVLEIEEQLIFGFPFYFTSIAIGTPPQAFSLLTDLDYGGLLVRSVDCGDDCGRDIFKYNPLASSTSHNLSQRFSVTAPRHTARGPMFADDMHLVSLKVPNASFRAADTFYGENILLLILSELIDG
ncbi:hypothetical protein K431DRAFT_293916 [Polychaeton citri CBS 116435]|uniref:Peptidase A1 domain-containing protein n=1 Tax=Polychaeton citri CBS 116435 TaxID=1314669 RepID=A0A9P4Q8K1_9PEZI|nr:hypothetical protein K431DRAFT_293916 [Polychaeton citri CBS 116435]